MLSDALLLDPTLPAAFEDVLDGCAALYGLYLDDRPLDAKRPEAARIHDELLRHGPLLRERSAETMSIDDPVFRRVFSESVLLWPAFAEVGRPIRFDSVGSASLRTFQPDLPSESAPKLGSALQGIFGWTDDALERLRDRCAYRTRNLALKRSIAERLAVLLGEGPPADRCRWLAKQLYGVTLDVRVDVVVGGAHVFVLLPFEDPRIAELVGVIRERNSFRTDRFPAFGLTPDDDLSLALLDDLHGIAPDVPIDVLRQTVNTMVTVVPVEASEQYLVHDLWGHGWQEAIGEFEWLYASSVHIADPLDPGAIVAAFPVEDGRVGLDPVRLRACVEADLRDRILCASNAHIAEMLADFVEHKHVRLYRPSDEAFPTSSLLPAQAVKLDLSLDDGVRYARAWSAAYVRLLDREDARRELAEGLERAGRPRAGLRSAVDEACALISTAFGSVLNADWAPLPQPERGVAVSAHRRLGLEVLSIQVALDAWLARADRLRAEHASEPPWRVPEASMDLLVMLLGHFFEEDRATHHWSLGALLDGPLPEAMARLGEALRQTP